MTQAEFYERTGLLVGRDLTECEFWEIHREYARSPLSKDDWCAQWARQTRDKCNSQWHKLQARIAEVQRDLRGMERHNGDKYAISKARKYGDRLRNCQNFLANRANLLTLHCRN